MCRHREWDKHALISATSSTSGVEPVHVHYSPFNHGAHAAFLIADVQVGPTGLGEVIAHIDDSVCNNRTKAPQHGGKLMSEGEGQEAPRGRQGAETSRRRHRSPASSAEGRRGTNDGVHAARDRTRGGRPESAAAARRAFL